MRARINKIQLMGFRGSAAAHCGNPAAFRIAGFVFERLRLLRGGGASRYSRNKITVRQSLTAMCYGKAAGALFSALNFSISSYNASLRRLSEVEE